MKNNGSQQKCSLTCSANIKDKLVKITVNKSDSLVHPWQIGVIGIRQEHVDSVLNSENPLYQKALESSNGNTGADTNSMIAAVVFYLDKLHSGETELLLVTEETYLAGQSPVVE